MLFFCLLRYNQTMSLSFRKVFFIWIVLCWLFSMIWLSTMARAEIPDPTKGAWSDPEHPLVIELFTASNCSACITADRILYDMAKDPNVIALSCHVQYWDEHTLSDPTGLEACTYRQWAYKSSGRMDDAEVKIPYMVVDGNESVFTGRLDFFYPRVQIVRERAPRLPLWIGMQWKGKDKILVTFPEIPRNYNINLRDSFSVWLIRYEDFIIQKIKGKDGKDRVLRFSNVVRKAKHIAKWHGESRTIEVAVPEPEGGSKKGGYVVIIHETNGSEIYAAGKLVDFKAENDQKNPEPKTKDRMPE